LPYGTPFLKTSEFNFVVRSLTDPRQWLDYLASRIEENRVLRTRAGETPGNPGSVDSGPLEPLIAQTVIRRQREKFDVTHGCRASFS